MAQAVPEVLVKASRPPRYTPIAKRQDKPERDRLLTKNDTELSFFRPHARSRSDRHDQAEVAADSATRTHGTPRTSSRAIR